MVVGFGLPGQEIAGKKNRKPLTDLFHIDEFCSPFNPKKLG